MDTLFFTGTSRKRRYLKSVQRAPGVTVAYLCYMPDRVIVGLDPHRAEAAVLVRYSAPQDTGYIFLGEGFKFYNEGSGQKRRYDGKKRIMRSRAYEDRIAPFDIRHKDILLRLIEAVDLIYEEYGPAAVYFYVLVRRVQDLAHLGDIGADSVYPEEVQSRLLRYVISERWVCAAGRAV
jgi:hypothetical protein